MMSYFRVFYKLVFVTLVISTFAIFSILTNLFIWSPFKKRTVISYLTSYASKAILWSLNFKIKQIGPLPKKGSLIIGNHMSYLDILIYASHFQTLFVTSTDMKARPFLGQITQLGGCLYVNRRNPKSLVKEIKDIKKYFDYGSSVTIFPEGTSSDGSSVLPFKKSLFQIALLTKCPIQPVTLCYNKIDGEKFSSLNCDKVCWYGDHLPFFPHLISLLRLKTVEATMSVLDTVDPSKFEDRKTLCEFTHQNVSNEYTRLTTC